jgi:hypothetical protein
MKTTEKIKSLSFNEALEAAKENAKSKLCTNDIRLLLGNGFSRAYYGKFDYTTLYQAIKDEKKNKNIKKLFEYFGTSNFEAVLNFLKRAQFLFKIYGIDGKDIIKDYERIKDALAEAILKVHPEKTTVIPEEAKINCYKFLKQFDDIYTVNYDLLLYWTLLTDPNLDFGDYFTRDQDTPNEYCEYVRDGSKKDKHVFFLHGGLHLFIKDGRTIKKVWGNTLPLIEQIKKEIENGYYPWVVAEGDHESKLQQIKSNPYLDHAFEKLSQNKGQLFTFGFSFSDQDLHIVKAIIKNCGIRYLWIGIHGNMSNKNNEQLIKIANYMIYERKKIAKGINKYTRGPLKVRFYDSSNMDIWGIKNS